MDGLRWASANLSKLGFTDVYNIRDSSCTLASSQAILSWEKGDIWNRVDFPAWCVTSVDQPTIFAPFSCSINWFLIFYALSMALALDMVQDTEIF